MTDSEIFREIGSKLWSIFREDADLACINYQGFSESGGGDMSIVFFHKNQRLKESLNDANPWEVWEAIRSLAIQLQKTPPFDREQFTHMKYSLTEDSKMDVKFAYIPEWDSWPGLYLSGVSQMPEEDAKKRPRFYETWKECRARFEKEPYTLPSV